VWVKPLKVGFLSSKDVFGLCCTRNEIYAWTGGTERAATRAAPFRADHSTLTAVQLCELLLDLSDSAATDETAKAQTALLNILAVSFEARVSASGEAEGSSQTALSVPQACETALLAQVLERVRPMLLNWAGRLPIEESANETSLARVAAARRALFAGWSIIKPAYTDREEVCFVRVRK
jgi:hypothetical protein